jgi:hypothetical protein
MGSDETFETAGLLTTSEQYFKIRHQVVSKEAA